MKYRAAWAETVFIYAKKYSKMLDGSLSELDSFSKSKRNNVLKSLIALSKFLGAYEDFKTRIKNHGIRWQRQDSLESFLRIYNGKEDVIEWVRKCITVLDENSALFIKFVMLTGLRKSEAVKSFNLIIRLSREGRLSEYFNAELGSLEHFKFEKEFLRTSKNAYFSFLPERFIEQIAKSKPVTYPSLRKHLRKHGLGLRLNELRHYHATFLIRNGLIKEEVDILQGRVGKSVFMRHYFTPAIGELRTRVLSAIERMMKTLDGANL